MFFFSASRQRNWAFARLQFITFAYARAGEKPSLLYSTTRWKNQFFCNRPLKTGECCNMCSDVTIVLPLLSLIKLFYQLLFLPSQVQSFDQLPKTHLIRSDINKHKQRACEKDSENSLRWKSDHGHQLVINFKADSLDIVAFLLHIGRELVIRQNQRLYHIETRATG